MCPLDRDALDPDRERSSARLLTSIDALGRRLGVEVVGIDRLPNGRALLVANHAFGFWDLAFAVARIRAETGRTLYSLGEHLWWRVPLLRRLAKEAGVVDGTPANADAILRADQLLLVLPGGLREALKPRELRYRLLWGRRYGFVRAALRNEAPIVPLACFGADEIFDLVGDPFHRSRKLRLSIPLPRPLPLLPIPHRAHLKFVVGEPIAVRGRGPADDLQAVRSLRRETEGALHELIEEELASRVGFAYDASSTLNWSATASRNR
jgi:1-acyl-sn-glycerol-3-phosphate acyltransferase